jgi:myosin-1
MNTSFSRDSYINIFAINHQSVILHVCFQNNVGILAILDEQCLLPGNVTDKTFLEKMNTTCKDHPHYESRALRKNQSDRSLPHDAFRLKHYAGNVNFLIILIVLIDIFF